MPWWRQPAYRPYGALLLIWFALNLPLLLGFRVLPSDAIEQFYPTVYFNAHSLHHGLAPWWNPSIYGGYPQIADPQGMLFSPLLMAWMLLPSSPGATWFVWGVLLHLLMGGTAMLGVLRQLGANAFGALIGAVVFMAGGVAASRLEHVPIVLAYAYAPVVLFALRHLLARPGWRRGLLFGMAAGAMTTQLVQLTYLLTLAIATYAVIASATQWGRYDAQARRQWLAGMALALPVALTIGLPQLACSLAFTALSNRAELPLAAAALASLSPRALISLFLPNGLHALRGDYSGPASVVEAYLYIGAVPTLLLGGLGLAWRDPQQRRQLLFFGMLALLATMYMFGVNTPFYAWLYTWLPGIKQFRRPSDAAYLLNIALAIATGLAATHVRLEAGRRLSWLLAIAAAWLLLSSLTMRDAGTPWQTATILAAPVATLAWWRTRRADASPARIAFWLLTVLVADYRCFNLNGTFNQLGDRAHSFLRDGGTVFLDRQLRASKALLPPRIEPFATAPYWDNLVVLRGLQSTQGYNPLRYALYDRWYGARESSSQPWPDTPYNPAPGSAISRLLGAEYLLRDGTHTPAPPMPPAEYERVFAGRTEVWRNAHAYPRLMNPVEARIADAPPAADVFAATDFSHTLWLTPRDAEDRRQAEIDAQGCTGRIRVLAAAATPTSLSMQVADDGRAGWLALGELDFPGWQARAAGAALPIHRANGMFRAVCVPAGTRMLEFRFHPWAMLTEAWQQRRRDR
jgi:hypothetical protein